MQRLQDLAWAACMIDSPSVLRKPRETENKYKDTGVPPTLCRAQGDRALK